MDMSPERVPIASANEATGLYLDLLKQSLTRLLSPDRYKPLGADEIDIWREAITASLRARGATLVMADAFDQQSRMEGRDWPAEAETMIGLQRLNNLQQCVEDVLKNNVPGDFIEAGVWRGGASIFLRGILKAFGVTDRTVWLADSFAGLPRPDAARYPEDAGDVHWGNPELAVPLERVRANFERYGLLDGQVAFLPGWFRDTLPNAPMASLSLLRLDGDLYESTMVALRALYPKVSRGGYVVIDDYGALKTCRAAVDDFRAEFQIEEQLVPIDWTGVYWRVERSIPRIAEPTPAAAPNDRIRAERTTTQNYDPALRLLLDLYERRPDLSKAFPEASNWDFRRLINWARSAAMGEFQDGSALDLKPFLAWFQANSVDTTAAEAPWDLLTASSSSSANRLVSTLNVMRSPASNDIGQHLMTLALLVTEFNLKEILELGTRDGNSTVALLEAARNIGGRVTSYDIEPCETAHECIASLGLDANWRFFQRDALGVPDTEIPQAIDLLFVDTFHLYTQTLAELRKFLPHMKEGGWIALHDSVSFPGVSRAVLEVIRSLDRRPNFYSFINQNGLTLLKLRSTLPRN
jgi:O-methyltransferase